jgi:hypothetical protein
MKGLLIISSLFFLTSCGNSISIKNEPEVYTVIKRVIVKVPDIDMDSNEEIECQIPGDLDSNSIQKLTKPYKALAAFYSAMGGSNCSEDKCDLTTLLKLGKQGSKKHKQLIKDYFPKDKVAELVLKQDCHLGQSGATFFSDFEYLTISKSNDTFTVDYRLMNYSRGELKWFEGPDSYLFKNNKFKKIKRNIWTFAED